MRQLTSHINFLHIPLSGTVRRNKARYSLAAQKLKAVELELKKSSRKCQSDKGKALKSLTKSLTVWLNFLLENPRLEYGFFLFCFHVTDL